MAQGRPALATVLMTIGIIALAVPGSAAFAGEFLILLGVFDQGWVWAAIGAGAIVLAAMYMLRVISAVLHQDRGPAVTDAALDLRPAELGILVPLIGYVLALSAWPAAISERAFRTTRPRSGSGAAVIVAAIPTPDVDWVGLSPSLVALGAASLALLGSVVVGPRPAPAARCGRCRARVHRHARRRGLRLLEDAQAAGPRRHRGAARPPRCVHTVHPRRGRPARIFVALVLDRPKQDHAGEYFALLAAAVTGMAFMVQANDLMTLFLGLEWFSLCLYVLCAVDIDLETSLESGLKYLIVGSFGSAILLFGSALVFGATEELSFPRSAQRARGTQDDPMLVVGLAMVLTGSASRLRPRRSTCGRRTCTRARRRR